jgi:predicted nucleic acid-binding protein
MTMTGGSSVFVDANMLVYSTFDQVEFYEAARNRLTELDKVPVRFWTTRQVLREFLAVTTRPGFIAPLPSVAFVSRVVSYFETRFKIAEDGRDVTALLLELLENPGAQGKQVHEANIAATMRHYGIPYLLTHNTADFKRYAPWITVLPLVP